MWRVVNSDCRLAVELMADNSVDSCVTDPPYALVSVQKRFGNPGSAPQQFGTDGAYARAAAGFMGQQWDTGETAFDPSFWFEVLRVLKPGGHLLAFGGTRTYHRLACAIEDAGFEIRDQIGWLYGSGFPKSHNVAVSIDKAAGIGPRAKAFNMKGGGSRADEFSNNGLEFLPPYEAVTADAKNWQGWGTALKPAWEPIVLARKPLDGTVAENVQRFGTGAINIDGCRVDGPSRRSMTGGMGRKGAPVFGAYARAEVQEIVADQGRWPANIIHDGSDEVEAAFPKDAARFFYCAKASKRDREEGLDGFEKKKAGTVSETSGQHITRRDEGYEVAKRANNHPTVKPTDLMRYLCRLVTPPGGTVLDPFTGSGSTGKAAILEGFNFIGVEREADYARIAEARIKFAEKKRLEDVLG